MLFTHKYLPIVVGMLITVYFVQEFWEDWRVMSYVGLIGFSVTSLLWLIEGGHGRVTALSKVAAGAYIISWIFNSFQEISWLQVVMLATFVPIVILSWGLILTTIYCLLNPWYETYDRVR